MGKPTAAYREARAQLDRRLAENPSPSEPTGLDALTTRRPELAEAAAVIAARNPGLCVESEEQADE